MRPGYKLLIVLGLTLSFFGTAYALQGNIASSQRHVKGNVRGITLGRGNVARQAIIATTPVATAEAFTQNDLLDLTNTRLVIDTAYQKHIWDQSSLEVPLNRPTSSGSLAGQFDDPSLSSHLVQAAGNLREPLWYTASGTKNTYIDFDGSNDLIDVQNSKKAFNFIHRGVSSTMMFTAWPTNIGATRYWFDSLNGTGANNGISILHQNDDQLQVLIAVAGTTILNYTSTALVTSSNWNDVMLRLDADGGALQINDKTEETFSYGAAIPAAASNADATFEFRIGGNSGLSSYGDFNLQKMVIMEAYATADEWESFKAWNPTADATSTLIQSRPVNEGRYNFLHRWMDFTVTSSPLSTNTMWKDIAGTDPVTTTGQTVAHVMHNLSRDLNFEYDLNRALIVTNTIYNASFLGATDGVNWTSSTRTNLEFNETWSFGGGKEVFMCVEVHTSDFSNHILTGGSYWAVTGPDYFDNTTPGNGYHVLHLAAGATRGSNLEDIAVGGRNLVHLSRDGSDMTMYTNNTNATSSVETAQWSPQRIGKDALSASALWLDGEIQELREYLTVFDDTQRQNIVNDMATNCSITL